MPKQFDKEQYDAYKRQIFYDDRDATSYENMLNFLWKYIIEGLDDERQWILEDYTKWNHRLIEKSYCHDRDHPHVSIRRCYQTVIHLLDGNWDEGLRQLDMIAESFSYDAFAPKSIMVDSGKVYDPQSRMFILYNYAKYFKNHGLHAEYERLTESYPYAFTKFGDEEHEMHDRMLEEQMAWFKECYFYPVFSRLYKIPWGKREFYLYYDLEKQLHNVI